VVNAPALGVYQWELFQQLRRDLSDYFGHLHGEIKSAREEISQLDQRLSKLEGESRSHDHHIQTNFGMTQVAAEAAVEAIEETLRLGARIDEKLSKFNVPVECPEATTPEQSTDCDKPLTPPESPQQPTMTPAHVDATKTESPDSEAPTPKIIPVYDERTKARHKTSRRIPIRCAIGASPTSESCASCYIPGVLVKGRMCTISKNYIPPGVTITKTNNKRKVTLPVYLANAAALSKDKRRGNALILQLWIEFQVLENSSTAFTIGQDAIKAHGYNLNIDRWRNVIVITNATNNFKMRPFRIPIIENPSRSSQPPIDPRPQCRTVSTNSTFMTVNTISTLTKSPASQSPSIGSYNSVGRQSHYDQRAEMRTSTDEGSLKRREVLHSVHPSTNDFTVKTNISLDHTRSDASEPTNAQMLEQLHSKKRAMMEKYGLSLEDWKRYAYGIP
jgi:hypothetical protein